MSTTLIAPEAPAPVPGLAPSLERDTEEGLHLWTRDEYHRMAETGLFNDKRVELLDGRVWEMPAQLTPHTTAVQLTSDLLRVLFAAGHIVRVQMSIALGRRSEPELVVPGTAHTYARHHPTPAEARLLVEVSDSTLRADRGKKARAYARAGIADYWIVNLINRRLEIHRGPMPDGHFQDVTAHGPDETVSPFALPDAVIRVADLLPPAPEQH